MPRPREISEETLNIVPFIVSGVEITKNEEGLAQVRIPRPKTRLMRFLCFIFKAGDYKMVVLDETGTEMLGLIDGQRTFRDLAEYLEKNRSLRVRQARESMAAFLARLSEERVIAFKRRIADGEAAEGGGA
jgi:hypothetical protein